MDYLEFLKRKIEIASESGFDIEPSQLNKALKPHQRAAVTWALRGGRRALFESFGLGKTIQEIEFCYQAAMHEKGPALIVLPLGVKQEFTRDAVELLGYEKPVYCRTMEEVKAGLLRPYVGAYTQLDFSLPCPSIFDTAEEIKNKYGIRAVRPLAPKTMERIARGLKKFVIDNAEPFIVPIGYGERKGQEPRVHDIKNPLPTVVGSGKHYLCEPYMVQIGQTGFTADRSKDVREPLTTIVSKNEHCLIAPTLIQYHSENASGEVRGQQLDEPIMTVDSSNRYGLVTSFLSKFYKSGIGQDMREPLGTVTANAGGGHFGEVRAFLIKYYGDATGQDIKAPLDTVTTKDRFGLVTVNGVDYQIVDIGLRMLEPKELYGCQGFPGDYIIDHDYTGKEYPRSEQVRRCGNAVCPPIPAALVKANLPELCICERMPNMRISEEAAGQLRFA